MLRSTLVSEGNSDRALCPILDWVIAQHAREAQGVTYADFARFGKPKSWRDRICVALDYYPCDLLFVHRDSDKQPPQWRYDEIRAATPKGRTVVCVVPIRMQESWFFVREEVIRRATGCPKGRQPLEIPRISQIEEIGNPKERLHELLRLASGTTGRDARRFSPEDAVLRISTLIEDWSFLRSLSAFQRLEEDTHNALHQLGAGT
jgi:hypothetical protein